MSFFITFEGIEGSGKTTQLKLLQAYLQKNGYDVLATREPGGCSISDTIRALLLDPGNNMMVPRAELLLYSAARAQHVAEVILPALNAGKVVICDRFTDATTVYQGVGRGLKIDQLNAINSFATIDIVPDMTILLDYPADQGLQRARNRNKDNNQEIEGRFELETLDFHNRIRQGYLELAAREARIHTVDGLGPEELIARRIISVIDRFLEARRRA